MRPGPRRSRSGRAAALRHGHRHVPRDALATQQGVDERAAGASVAVGERVDRLELGVRHRRLDEHRQVVAGHEVDEVRMAGSIRVWWGGTNSALTGVLPAPPIHTGSTRQPTRCGAVPPSSAACIRRMASASSRSASAIAAVIASTLAATTAALPRPVPVSSASATARAEAVSCSICDEDADSLRSRIASRARGPPGCQRPWLVGLGVEGPHLGDRLLRLGDDVRAGRGAEGRRSRARRRRHTCGPPPIAPRGSLPRARAAGPRRAARSLIAGQARPRSAPASVGHALRLSLSDLTDKRLHVALATWRGPATARRPHLR